jgi:hypothetical protein
MMQCNVGCNTADTKLMKQFDVRFEGMPNSMKRRRLRARESDRSRMTGLL